MTVHDANTRPGEEHRATTEAPSASDTLAVLSDPIILQRTLFFHQLRLMKATRVTTLIGGQK